MEGTTHYVCTGECGGVSAHPGTCQAESCSMHGQPLKECSCDAPEHMVDEDDEKAE